MTIQLPLIVIVVRRDLPMREFPGYASIEEVGETRHSVVYRARSLSRPGTVIIKVLKADNPTAAEVARFKHDYQLIQDSSLEGIVKTLDIISRDGLLALVMEDFDAPSLHGLIPAGLTVQRFLDLAVRIADILGNLHRSGITHRDIKPANILIKEAQDIIKLTDFGMASEITRANGDIYNPAVIEGTLAYLSPEQTGRINCPVDYRSDLYSLGVTFYQMLTGGVPFTTRDPLEIIHAHIAKTPVQPREINPDIPEVISSIVMKLLAKSPEERYQNSFGLMHDLKTCLSQLRNTGRVEPFDLARRDVSLKFNIPQVVVGRDEDVALLYQAFERVSSGSLEVMLVTGEPGIGKSALVGEVRKPIVAKKGYFLSGKFDQLRRYVPYSAVIQAFQALARQLLTESGERIAQWRKRLLEAFGPNGRIIADAIPEIELITGRQPDIPELGIEETQNRFIITFKNFVKVFATREHPLVLFLDDLQWADSASLNLIEAVTTDKSFSHFLIIGAYRDNEVGPHHPFTLTLDEILKKNIPVHSLKLSVLTAVNVNRIFTNFLRCGPDVSASLSMVVHEKTLGNPFFVIQFLKTLYEERYLVLDAVHGWQWDAEAIKGMQVTDNVVDLMAEKISRLPSDPRDLIQVCACIGNRFEIETLATVMERSIDEVLYTMDELIKQGLINYSNGLYRFHHDRIQEAAYTLIPPEEKERFHYHIARQLLEMTPADELPVKIFYITDQFNHARSLVVSGEEKRLVAGLNLKAGIKAKESTAYAAAASYLKAGMELLSDDAWREQYGLAYDLNVVRMECEYRNRNYRESERLFSDIIRNAATKVDKAKACTSMIELYTTIGKYTEAIDLGIEHMKMFGVRLSRNAGKLAVARELVGFLMKLRKVGVENIEGLHMMTDEEISCITELQGATGLPAYYTNPNLFAITVLNGTTLSLTHGYTHASSYGLMATAVIMGSVLGDYDKAMHLGEIALRLNEEHDEKPYACKVHFVYTYLILHWKKHLRDCLELFRKAYKLGLESGDLLYSCHCITSMGMSRFIMGDNLDDVMKDHLPYKDYVEGTKDPYLINNYKETLLACLNLKGQTVSPLSLSTKDFNEEEQLAAIRESGHKLNLFYRLLIMERYHYLFGSYEEAYRIGFEMDTMLEILRGTFRLAEHYLYRCLSLLAVYPEKSFREKRRIMGILKRHGKKMKKWARICPANFLPKHLLIEAELTAVRGRFEEACHLFDQAVSSAREHGYTNIEALANERAGLFCQGRGFDRMSEPYLKAAHQAYERWGATAKMRELEKAHPFLTGREVKPRPTDESHPVDSSAGMASNQLDLSTVMQVSQAISGEIMLDRLLGKIMKMAIINAGAQKGFLILDSDGHLTIEGAGKEGDEEVKVMQSLPVETCLELSSAIVHYAFRSGQDVILGNASQSGPFISDPYVMRNSCKSILATPVMSKGKTSGILYMENDLAANAFTPERLELLRIISSQAAISLDNARLFDLATTDGLTKLFVHRYFQLLLDQELQRSRRSLKPFSLVMMDIDDFKRFNDTYGHQLGDEVLRQVARTLKASVRAVDSPSRYGGEEFVLILPETDTNGALVVAEKVRKAVEDIAIPCGNETLRVTISLGLATFPLHADGKEALIQSADAALYLSKRLGKNRVCTGVEMISMGEESSSPAG
jgi:diguanylate cyclase (GGDEF)-like protein